MSSGSPLLDRQFVYKAIESVVSWYNVTVLGAQLQLVNTGLCWEVGFLQFSAVLKRKMGTRLRVTIHWFVLQLSLWTAVGQEVLHTHTHTGYEYWILNIVHMSTMHARSWLQLLLIPQTFCSCWPPILFTTYSSHQRTWWSTSLTKASSTETPVLLSLHWPNQWLQVSLGWYAFPSSRPHLSLQSKITRWRLMLPCQSLAPVTMLTLPSF